MYSQDHFTDEDRAVLCDGCEIECKFNKKDSSMIEQIKEKILAIIENHRKLQNNVKSFNPDLAMGLQALIDEDNYILSAINSMPKYSESDVWHDGKDRPPFAGKEILVRRGDKTTMVSI